jgi:hypothetical protein
MARPIFGHGDLAVDPAKSVFINCPFDAEFATLFDAIVFATVCCGFTPRSALESGTVSEPRIARIVRALANSKYSIHDLSRCTGEGVENIARFNMPLELGMAMAEHDWLVLVPRGHPYARFVSDLAAYDPVAHDGSIPSVIMAVMSWLATRPDAIQTATPLEVLALLPTFENRRQALNEAWGGLPPWAHILVLAIEIAKQLA